MKCLSLSIVTAVVLTYFNVTTATTTMDANSNNPKAPPASVARPHFPVLRDVARQEKVFLEGLQNKASIKVMASDGACFFRSICDQLHHDGGEGHATLRAGICNWIEANKQQYSDFFSHDDAGINAESIDSHIKDMRVQNTHATNLEVIAASAVVKRRISVFSFDYPNGLDILHESVSHTTGRSLTISRHNDNHYNSLYFCSNRSGDRTTGPNGGPGDRTE